VNQKNLPDAYPKLRVTLTPDEYAFVKAHHRGWVRQLVAEEIRIKKMMDRWQKRGTPIDIEDEYHLGLGPDRKEGES